MSEGIAGCADCTGTAEDRSVRGCGRSPTLSGARSGGAARDCLVAAGLGGTTGCCQCRLTAPTPGTGLHLGRLAVALHQVSVLRPMRRAVFRQQADGAPRALASEAPPVCAVCAVRRSFFASRQSEVKKEISRLDLPVLRTFLLPDNEQAGNLETLLEQMASVDHQAVYGCLDKYEGCLKRLDSKYVLPNQKARIYAYCEAVGARLDQIRTTDAQRTGI